MDISKYSKPIHITCPKCGHELEFNGKDIIADKMRYKDEMLTLKARMQTHRNEHGKDGYYAKLLKQYDDALVRYQRAKQMAQLASEQSEIQMFCMFKKACMEEFGKEKIISMLEEIEKEISYRTEELMKQKYNNFEKA